jgi:uncharacterized membrane protein
MSPADELHGHSETGADRSPPGARRAMLLGVAAFFVARVPLLLRRVFDPDELEHAHAAWCVFRGMLPYRDFFEHHTPWYYYTLRPIFRWFTVDVSFDSARHFLLFGRVLSFALTILAVVLVYRIGNRWGDRRLGALAALFLVGQPVFLQKTLEARPDVPALLFFLVALGCLLRALEGAGSLEERLRRFAGGGLSLGAGIMYTQKLLFTLPGLLCGLGLWWLSGDRGPTRRARALLMVVFLLAVGVPFTLTWAAFALQGGADSFIANNFLLNAHWKHVATGQLLKLLETSAPVLLLSVLGMAAAGRGFFRSPQRDHREILLLCTVLGLFAGVAVIPTAQRQYYLPALPIVCFFAAKGLLLLVDRARKRTRWLLLALLPLSVLPVVALGEAFVSPNDLQLARLRQVFESTQPTDLVMDGWEGTGVFRPHAFYYFFIHDELLPMLSQSRVDAYLTALESGQIRPKLIALDEHLVALGPRFLRFLAARYVSGDGFLYYARD